MIMMIVLLQSLYFCWHGHPPLTQEELRDQERIQMLREAERLKEDELQQVRRSTRTGQPGLACMYGRCLWSRDGTHRGEPALMSRRALLLPGSYKKNKHQFGGPMS